MPCSTPGHRWRGLALGQRGGRSDRSISMRLLTGGVALKAGRRDTFGGHPRSHPCNPHRPMATKPFKRVGDVFASWMKDQGWKRRGERFEKRIEAIDATVEF